MAGIAVGQLADLVVLDAGHLALQGLCAEQMLSAHVFASHRGSAIDAVWVAGQQRVVAKRHALHEAAAAAFVAARTDPDAKGSRGITMFMIERGTPGLSVSRSLNKMGCS